MRLKPSGTDDRVPPDTGCHAQYGTRYCAVRELPEAAS